MIRHYTPVEVAHALAKHAPRRMSSLLEPAVGTGFLLRPFEKLCQESLERIVCIDTDAEALEEVTSRFAAAGKRFEPICADFLQWSAPESSARTRALFDCILMNPPFAGRRNCFVELNLATEVPGIGSGSKKVPTEIAFVLRSIELLKAGGRLLAVVPSSLVSSISTTWVRNYLMVSGSVRYVHELPSFTFKGVEARVYLFVFEKSLDKRSVVLCNHDLARPLILKVATSHLISWPRFDYRFHDALRKYEMVKNSSSHLEWKPVSDLASVHRGAMNSLEGARHSLHTCDYQHGFWRLKDEKKKIHKDVTERRVKRGDLLIKRVGRRCSLSLGKVVGHIGDSTSDCILTVRAREPATSTALLFGLRIILTSEFGQPLIECATGASYLTERGLLQTLVPTKLKEFYKPFLCNYAKAASRRDFCKMVRIEKQVRDLILANRTWLDKQDPANCSQKVTAAPSRPQESIPAQTKR